MSNPLPKRPQSIQQRVEQRQNRMKVLRYFIFLPTVLIGAITAGGAFFWPSVPDVTTGQSSQYEDIQPQFMTQSPSEIRQGFTDIVNQHPKRFHFDPERTYPQADDDIALYLIAEGPLLPLRTRIEITIRKSQSSRSVINMEATGANSGKTDFGLKARNVRFLQDQIEAYFVAPR